MANERKYKVNFWAFLRDVILRSIDRGQFPIVIFGLILLIYAIKWPTSDIPRLFDKIGRDLKSAAGLSYVVNVLLLMGWATHARNQRARLNAEMTRIGVEKGSLQEQLIQKGLSKSRNK